MSISVQCVHAGITAVLFGQGGLDNQLGAIL